MTNHVRVGTLTNRIAWMIGVMVPVAALTSYTVPLRWGFALIYVTIGFGLQTLVRLKDPSIERFAHIFVLSGSAPIMVRSFYGPELAAVGVLHVVALLVISTGIGYLLADRVRPQTQRQDTSEESAWTTSS